MKDWGGGEVHRVIASRSHFVQGTAAWETTGVLREDFNPVQWKNLKVHCTSLPAFLLLNEMNFKKPNIFLMTWDHYC